MIIKLTLSEQALATFVGTRRRILSMYKNIPGKRKREEGKEWRDDIEGAAAELAVAKLINQYWWADVGDWRKADVGKDVQVKWTSYPTGHLIIWPEYDSSQWFYLVLGKIPDMNVVGCIQAGEAMAHDEWLKDPNGRGKGWYIPQSVLSPVENDQEVA